MITDTSKNVNTENAAVECQFGDAKEIKAQLINWFVSQPSFIQVLYPEFMWEV